MDAQTRARDETDVLLSIRNRIWRNGSHPSEWYVGVCPDPERELFQRHGVRRSDDWTYLMAPTPEDAARVAQYLISGLGADGFAARQPQGPAYVFAYRKAPHTRGWTGFANGAAFTF